MRFLEARRQAVPSADKMADGPSADKGTLPSGKAGGRQVIGQPDRRQRSGERDERFASDEAETLALEHEIDPASITGSGRDGKITTSDVRKTIGS